MKVLVADQFEKWGIDALKEMGCEVVFDPSLKDQALRDAIAKSECSVLIVRGTVVSEEALQAGKELALVVRAGAGFNTIDVAAASRLSILVANCPGKNAVAVAELTFALILALDRRVVDNTNDLRAGVWNKKEYSKAKGLKGRTLGIIGMGQIGKAVAARAHAFEMPIAAWSRSLSDETAAEYSAVRCAGPGDVAAQCDILSIHLALTPQTKGIISTEVLDRLKPESYVINTARSEVMDYEALARIVKEKNLRVGLDAYPQEPSSGAGKFTPAILEAGGIICGTHHIGASTDQAQDAIAAETVRIVRTFATTGRAINCVNLRQSSPATWCLTVRHLNKPGVLAHVLHELSHAGINVEEMDNVITSTGHAACAHINLDASPPPTVLDRIRTGNCSVLAASVTAGKVAS